MKSSKYFHLYRRYFGEFVLCVMETVHGEMILSTCDCKGLLWLWRYCCSVLVNSLWHNSCKCCISCWSVNIISCNIVHFISRYRPSAATYALTRASFEEVTLKFIQVSESDSLKVFLVKKLNNLDSKVQCITYSSFSLILWYICYATNYLL